MQNHLLQILQLFRIENSKIVENFIPSYSFPRIEVDCIETSKKTSVNPYVTISHPNSHRDATLHQGLQISQLPKNSNNISEWLGSQIKVVHIIHWIKKNTQTILLLVRNDCVQLRQRIFYHNLESVKPPRALGKWSDVSCVHSQEISSSKRNKNICKSTEGFLYCSGIGIGLNGSNATTQTARKSFPTRFWILKLFVSRSISIEYQFPT